MELNDTQKLLLECDAGTKMAVSAIDEVLARVKSSTLNALLIDSKDQHEALGNHIHNLLNLRGQDGKEPKAIAKGMAWLKTNLKLGLDDEDCTVADLITDGCHMGIKSLHRYHNQFGAADAESKSICTELIAIEQSLVVALYSYL